MTTEYQVRPGDCINSIAFEHGHFWETIWNHADNQKLKQDRKSPGVLREGDIVRIPDLRLREETRDSDSKHRFKLIGVPAKLKLRVMKPPQAKKKKPAGGGGPPAPSGGSFLSNAIQSVGAALSLPIGDAPKKDVSEDPEPDASSSKEEPWADAKYVVLIDGKKIEGRTDGDGNIECSIPPNAREGRLMVEPGKPEELILPLKLGHLDPITELTGVKQRLANLGFGCHDDSNDPTPELEAALRVFQERQGLEVTGTADANTRNKLKDAHGS